MCRTILILSLLLLILPVKAQPKYEVRAAWITAVYGLDWPRTRATTPQTIRKQKEELVDILDKLKAANFNTVLFQTRTRGDVLYPSSIEPFNSILTGKVGGNPGYDPLAFAIEECHKRGIILAIDAIQSMGRLTMRPRQWHISYVAGGAHKGCLGTKGGGYVYCAKELSQILKPYTGSLQSLTNGGRPFPLRHYDQIQWQPDASRLEGGMYSFGIIESLANGVSLINELGIENVEAHIHAMENYLRGKLADLPLKVLDIPEKNRSGLLFIWYPEGADPKAVEQVLLDHKVRATVRQGYIRMGLHFYNTQEQMDRVSQALHEIAKLS